MKNLKSILTVVAIIISTSIFAQPPGGGKQGPPALPDTEEIAKMVTEMSEEINLDETQQESVLEVYTDHFEAVSEKMEAGRPDRDEMEALDAKLEEDVKALLSDDQIELYSAYLESKKKDRPKR